MAEAREGGVRPSRGVSGASQLQTGFLSEADAPADRSFPEARSLKQVVIDGLTRLETTSDIDLLP